MKAGALNVTLINYRNTDALDRVPGAARNTLLCPRMCPRSFDADRTLTLFPLELNRDSLQWSSAAFSGAVVTQSYLLILQDIAQIDTISS